MWNCLMPTDLFQASAHSSDRYSWAEYLWNLLIHVPVWDVSQSSVWQAEYNGAAWS